MGYFAQYPASPLRDFFTLRQKGRLDDLQKEETHIVLLHHLLHDKIYAFEPLLHQLLDLSELILDSFDEDVGQVFVVIAEEGDSLLSVEIYAGH